MGLWDLVKNIGTNVESAIAEKANEIRQIHDKYEAMSDDELIQIANGRHFIRASSTEKGIAFKVLKSRGYNPEDLKPR